MPLRTIGPRPSDGWKALLEQHAPLAVDYGLSKDFRLFNSEIGLPISPITNLPAKELTPYQVVMGEYPGKRTVTNKSNKVGVTDLFLRKNLYRGIAGDCQGYQILYGSSKEKMANENIGRTAEIIDRSDRLRPLLDGEPTDSRIRLKNGTEFIALPRKVSGFRSWPRVKSIFLDEAAHYELIEDEAFFAAALARLSNTNGYLDLVSTPHGKRGYFYRVYTDAVLGNNGFKHWEVPYQAGLAAGIISEEIIDEARRAMTKEMFQQEFECEFNGAAYSAIEPDLVKAMREEYESE